MNLCDDEQRDTSDELTAPGRTPAFDQLIVE